MSEKQLYVELVALTSKYQTDLEKASKTTEKFGKKATDVGDNMESGFTKNIGNIVKGFIGLELAQRAWAAAKYTIQLEEQLKKMNLSLQNVTEKNGDFGRSLAFIKDLADKTGQDVFVLGDSYKNVYASAMQAGMATDSINTIFNSVVRSGSALKLSNEQVSLSLKAIEQMMNKGVIGSEELRQQLGDHIPGSFSLMAKAAKDAGISLTGSTQELQKLLEQGKVASNVVLPYFAKRMEEAFGKNAEANINTISGSANRMRNELSYLVAELDNGKVLSFWTTMQNGIADTFKDLNYLVKSGSWSEFVGYFTGGQQVRGLRIATGMQDENFSKKSKKEQIDTLNGLIDKLKEARTNTEGLVKAGINPNNSYLVALTDQVKRYSDILKASGKATSDIIAPPSTGKGNAIKDYTFDMKLLALETQVTTENIRKLQEQMQLSKMKTIKGSFETIAPTLSRSEDLAKPQKDLIEKLFGGDLSNSTKRLQEKFDAIQNKIKPSLATFTEEFTRNTQLAQESIATALDMSFSFLGDVFAQGFESIFTGKIDFKKGFKQILGSFLVGLGDLVTKMGQKLLVAAIAKDAAEKALVSFFGGAVPAAIALIGIGSALKGGGMAMSGGTNSQITSNGGGYSNNSYTGPKYGQTLNLKVQGLSLIHI